VSWRADSRVRPSPRLHAFFGPPAQGTTVYRASATGEWPNVVASGLHTIVFMNRMQVKRLDQPSVETTSTRPVAVELSGTSVTFGRGDRAVPALATTSLRIADGDFVALVGPSGCGKSTILRLVGGLVRPSTGVVVVGGREVAAKALRIGMAFQNPTLLPWMTIEQNVLLPLKIVEPFRSEYRKKRRTEFRDKAHALLDQVGLKGFASRFPWQLSGGMLQRANLCRALIHEPRLLLLDEPFGALDQFTREELWSTLQTLWLTHRPTVLLVTHDLREAGFLANRICVMSARPGRIVDDSAVPFSRPRTIQMTFESDFVALNQRLRELIVNARTMAVDGDAA
jgi:NitT/TauT family transport system ATP-binding protein